MLEFIPQYRCATLPENETQNVALEWLALLAPSRVSRCEIPGDRLSWSFSWFSSVPPGRYRDRTLNYAKIASLYSLFVSLVTVHFHPVPLHTAQATEGVVIWTKHKQIRNESYFLGVKDTAVSDLQLKYVPACFYVILSKASNNDWLIPSELHWTLSVTWRRVCVTKRRV
jgi:hypothetical protein